MKKWDFTILTDDSGKDGKTQNARSGVLTIGNLSIPTPVFMPVGTQGALKAFDHSFLINLGPPQGSHLSQGYQLILSNTYYLVLRPGLDILEKANGLKGFMNLESALLTDSGGFQAYSLSHLVKITDAGIEFRSHIDGSLHHFTPENVLKAQSIIGSDIRMLLDQVVPFGEEKNIYASAAKRTNMWAKRSKKYLKEEMEKKEIPLGGGQGMAFPIMQGGFFPDLRKCAAAELVDMDFPGYAVGGLSVGEERSLFMEMAYLSGSLLPKEKPRYIMGVGAIQDLLISMDAGMDMFDCVLPTRNARNGCFLTSRGERNIRNAKFRELQEPIDPDCHCRICRTFTAAYLHHLFKCKEILAAMTATEHNLYFINNFIHKARQSITKGLFKNFFKEWLQIYPLNKGKRGISDGKLSYLAK